MIVQLPQQGVRKVPVQIRQHISEEQEANIQETLSKIADKLPQSQVVNSVTVALAYEIILVNKQGVELRFDASFA